MLNELDDCEKKKVVISFKDSVIKAQNSQVSNQQNTILKLDKIGYEQADIIDSLIIQNHQQEMKISKQHTTIWELLIGIVAELGILIFQHEK